MTVEAFPPSAAAPAVTPPSPDVGRRHSQSKALRRQPGNAPDWRRIAGALVLVLATVICYLPSLRGGFLWDDRAVLTNDPLMKSAAGLWRIWFSTIPYDYYPVNYTSLWLEWHLWGADPLGYRIVNLALHIGCAFLLWRLLTFWRLRGAWWAALLFALHPLNVASVAWIVERKNVLSMAFYLAALLCWSRAEETTTPAQRRTWYLGALIAFALALGSKSSVVMLPCVLLLLVWWRRGEIRWQDFLRTCPFFGLSLVAGVVSIWFQQHRAMLPAEAAAGLPPMARAALLGKTIWFYLGKVWFPHPLVMIYPRWRLLPAGMRDLWPLGLLLILCASLARLAVRHGWRGPAAALAYFCLSLLPVTGLFQMTFYKLSYVSDHLVYVALLGMCALCAAAFSMDWPHPAWRRISAVARFGIVATCAVLTWQRAGDFGSAERLWGNTVTLNPTSAAAQDNYGEALEESGHPAAAEAHFRLALRLEPKSPAVLTSLATLLRQEHRWPEAARIYRQLLAGPAEPEDHNNYGVVLLYLGEAANAAAQFHEALSGDPTLFSAHYNLYKLALGNHDQAAAAAEVTACRQLDPDNTLRAQFRL